VTLGGIYVITNSLDGMQYVGQTNSFERRWESHIKDAFPLGLSPSQASLFAGSVDRGIPPLVWAMRTFGLPVFMFNVLAMDELPSRPGDFDNAERYWINKLNTVWPNGYNRTKGISRRRSRLGVT